MLTEFDKNKLIVSNNNLALKREVGTGMFYLKNGRNALLNASGLSAGALEHSSIYSFIYILFSILTLPTYNMLVTFYYIFFIYSDFVFY